MKEDYYITQDGGLTRHENTVYFESSNCSMLKSALRGIEIKYQATFYCSFALCYKNMRM
ncbi:MAG TPA: hypothetical protein VKL21_09130 [Candidatus Methanoperedens sp.]|nr:hypothetical protein [Candidatus Methanoperedens sp.]